MEALQKTFYTFLFRLVVKNYMLVVLLKEESVLRVLDCPFCQSQGHQTSVLAVVWHCCFFHIATFNAEKKCYWWTDGLFAL